MPAAPLPHDESERISALRDLQILDTDPEEAFDQIVRLVSRLFDAPIALVSLVDEDRQWFKARVGLGAIETPRSQAFCAHAILDDVPLLVPDATKDPRFSDNPLVTGAPDIRFYLGVPLITDEGARIGTLCVIDQEPRTPPQDLVTLLQEQARIVVAQLELRRASRRLMEHNRALERSNELLKSFAHALAHDVMSPIRHMEFFLGELVKVVPEAGQQDLTLVTGAAQQLKRLVLALQEYVITGGLMTIAPVDLSLTILAASAGQEGRLEAIGATLTIGELPAVMGHGDHLQRVFTNLLSNAIKYRSDRPLTIDISARPVDAGWRIEVRDNGQGIAPRFQERVFTPFERLHRQSEVPGSGLGLTLCKQVILSCGGTIGVDSEAGVGSTFWFELPAA